MTNNLIEAVKKTVVDNRQIIDLEARLARAEQLFEKESRQQIVGEEFLNREYFFGVAKGIVRIGNATLYHGDCLEILPTIGKLDLVLTDPPFGVGNFVQIGGNVRGRGDSKGKKVTWNNSPPPPEFFDTIRKMSKNRIIWGANFFNCFEDKGGAIIWDKCQPMPNFSKADIASCTHYQKTEIVKIPWTNFTVARKAESDHPCERPVDLYEWCINYLPSDVVCDPYMGSGSSGVAAMRLGKKFIGIEINREYFDVACRRIKEAQMQTRMF